MVITALIIILKIKIIDINTILTTIVLAGGKPVDASQEMVALGICNILGSFVQAMPTTGSFSRFLKKSSQEFRKLPYTGNTWKVKFKCQLVFSVCPVHYHYDHHDQHDHHVHHDHHDLGNHDDHGEKGGT